MRNRVRVERETCETAGDMESNLAAAPVAEPAEREFPPSNWGPQGALLGAVLAIVVGLVLGLPAIAFTDSAGDLTTAGNVIAQVGLVIGLLGVPLALAHSRGASTLGECLRRLGVQRFRPSALKWMAASVGAYFAFAVAYSALILEPEQEDIAESFGPLPIQILLIVLAAAVAEEICFRGMLFGGLRERLPKVVAGLIAGTVFGLLHAFTGISAVPPLIVFGFVLCLLYEKTGSVVPGMILHALNNSVALLAQ
jgi:membrane protease YdiL (CAAX protease family)